MASEEPAVCSFVDQTTWELLNLLDIVGRRNGRVLVMEVDNDSVRAPSVLLDFAQDLCGTADVRAKLQQAERMEEEEEVRPHLVFMLWQAAVLKQLMRWEHLDEALWDVRSLLPCLPDVLVLVMIHPGPQEQLDQAVGALRRLQCLLDGAWQLVVEAAVYSPGQPGGILEAKRAACRALREVLNCHEGILGHSQTQGQGTQRQAFWKYKHAQGGAWKGLRDSVDQHDVWWLGSDTGGKLN
ncbi:uncharacterized protein [Haliaeetus albicilla]|uniref:uncharacterized protein isoform X1 n=1 Tax=Haliaeetus albicilla TaxID=8969 RepID=UPI0037E80A38